MSCESSMVFQEEYGEGSIRDSPSGRRWMGFVNDKRLTKGDV